MQVGRWRMVRARYPRVIVNRAWEFAGGWSKNHRDPARVEDGDLS